LSFPRWFFIWAHSLRLPATPDMRAWLVDQFGEPEQMRLAEVPDPEPGEGLVKIRVRAAGLNFFDLLQVRGQYQVKPPFPFTLGAEVAGETEAGGRVFGFCRQGGLAEYALVARDRVFPIPSLFDFAQGAGFLVVYHTSWFALTHRGKLQSGEWLLVHAGASGTGMSAIQIGVALGAKVIATAGSEQKLEFCRRQGASHALNYRNPAWVDEVKQITGKGADVIYDPVGGDVFDLSSKCIAPDGRLLVIGFASGRISSIAANRLLLKNMSATGVYWGGYLTAHPEYFREAQAALDPLIAQGKLKPEVSSRYAFGDAPKAVREIENRTILGKAVVVMD
jgi:NADPH:quinone reductase